MGASKQSRTKLALKEFKKLRNKASTRDNVYCYLSGKYGLKESSIRAAVSRNGLTNKSISLKRIFSKKEEEALAAVCVRQARQYRPFTIPELCQVARKFAGCLKKHRTFSRKFVSFFLRRHHQVLCMKRGLLTSPRRCSRTTPSKTQEFIQLLDSDVQSNRINSQNIVVFDETTIGDSVTVPLVVGERRKSGGSNNNYAHTRQARLGCYIPFSMPDGTTPFRVFIFKSEDLEKNGAGFEVLRPNREKGFRDDPCRLYLSSDTGFLNKALFEYVIIRFAMWWKSTHGPVDCFMTSDNLPIHKNKAIVEFAEGMGIHMYNIMPGTSHWFQVHDQQPFGALKKKMTEGKFQLWKSSATQAEDSMDLFTCLFYQAEMDAFETQVIRKTFADVGLWPWNPQKIMQNCRENCPEDSPLKKSRLIKQLLKIIDDIDQSKKRFVEQMMQEMKKEQVVSQQEVEEKVRFERKFAEKLFGVMKKKRPRSNVEKKSKCTEPPSKRARCAKAAEPHNR